MSEKKEIERLKRFEESIYACEDAFREEFKLARESKTEEEYELHKQRAFEYHKMWMDTYSMTTKDAESTKELRWDKVKTYVTTGASVLCKVVSLAFFGYEIKRGYDCEIANKIPVSRTFRDILSWCRPKSVE